MIPGPRSQALSAALRQVESPHVTFVAPDGRFPVFWDEAHDCTVIDVDGNVYLDLTAAFGVMSVGHSNPRVVAAIREQAGRLIHGMGDVHPTRLKVALAEALCERAPGDLGAVFFGTSGGDAVEAALKSARRATGKPGVIAFTGGYHGLNLGALAVTARDDFRAPFSGQLPTFATHLPYGCPMGQLSAALDADAQLGAILAEPIQARGGIVVPPEGWLRELRALCDARGVLLILDEIYTGFGRTGDWFAADAEGVVPDLLCVGKALGGGMPISACLMRPRVAAAWGESTGEALHTSTFLGHPLACAAALAALQELERLDAPYRVRQRGARLQERLHALQDRFPESVIEVRGRGLMLGIRLRSRALGLSLVDDLLALGLIVLPAGDGSILELTPPFVLTEQEIDRAASHLASALSRRKDF
jgi:4-aminobutyrate aminotransferase-like enzyme